jgi:flagellar biosynthesis protein FlhB
MNKYLKKYIEIGKCVFISDNDILKNSDDYLKGNVFYKFNSLPYKSIESIEKKIKRMCLLVVRNNECAVGLEYETGKISTPVIVLKSENVSEIISVCKKYDITIKRDKKLALALYQYGEIEQIIPNRYWGYTAKVFVKIGEKDKKFFEKIRSDKL